MPSSTQLTLLPSSTVFACVRASSLGLAVSDLSWVYCWAAIWGNIELGFGILGAVSITSPTPEPHYHKPKPHLTHYPCRRTSPSPAPTGTSSSAASTPSPAKPAPPPPPHTRAKTREAARTPTPYTPCKKTLPDPARTATSTPRKPSPTTPPLPPLLQAPGTAQEARLLKARMSAFRGGGAVVRGVGRRMRFLLAEIWEWEWEWGLKGRLNLALRRIRGVRLELGLVRRKLVGNGIWRGRGVRVDL